MIKRKDDLIPIHLIGTIDGTGIRNLFSVRLGTGHQCQAMSNGLFIFRVDIISIAFINNYSHSGIRYRQCTLLCFTKFRPVRINGVWRHLHKVGQLHKIEWKILPPVLTPVLDNQREKLTILIGTGSIVFPLIPDSTTDTVRHQRMDHSIV